MVLSEGGREVLEAARKRLATAKSQATAATQMLVHAQSMSDTANKEVKEAQTALEEVEKKYEVIDVDGDDLNPNEGSNKRRKVSLSPQNNYDSTARNNTSATSNNNSTRVLVSGSSSSSSNSVRAAGGNNVAARAQGQGSNNSSVANFNHMNIFQALHQMGIVLGGGSSPSANTTTATIPRNLASGTHRTDMNVSTGGKIVVSRCGYPGVNGVYKQENGSLFEGAPVFTKQVMGSNTFAIYRVPSNQRYWYVGHWNRNTNSELPSSRLYKSNLYKRECKLIPPDDGWASCSKQRSSQQVPTCRFLSTAAASSAAATAVNELVVSGCGLSMANGTYKKTIRRCNGLPRYVKEGQITFDITSIFNDKYQQWMISQHGAKSMYKSEVILRVVEKLDGAPLDNSSWCLVREGEGVRPPPQVKRG